VATLLSPQQEFIPQLNEEHRSYEWILVGEAAKLENLHPVVEILFADPSRCPPTPPFSPIHTITLKLTMDRFPI